MLTQEHVIRQIYQLNELILVFDAKYHNVHKRIHKSLHTDRPKYSLTLLVP